MAAPSSVEAADFIIDCPGCDGAGETSVHAYRDKTCIVCRGKGQVMTQLVIPKPGQKVRVRIGHQPLLDDMFGLHDKGPNKGKPKITHQNVAVVHDTQLPEEHMLELRTGLGVRVNFDGALTKTGAIPKGTTVDLWTFDLYELVIVG